ncbi:hypothetical protein DFH09DRAFT_1366091 [Mycena vulgaris]|nr:hypothetical protein DFH09DRAFT_1366091 [Mycena vulgaris]
MVLWVARARHWARGSASVMKSRLTMRKRSPMSFEAHIVNEDAGRIKDRDTLCFFTYSFDHMCSLVVPGLPDRSMEVTGIRKRSELVDDDTREERRARKLESAAAYRERNRSEIRKTDKERRHRTYIEENGLAAFEARELLRYMNKTQLQHEGHPPPRRPMPAIVSNKAKRRKLEIARPVSENGNTDEEPECSARARSLSPFSPIHCPCVGKERCDKCRICRCMAPWCQEEHPPGMQRPVMAPRR